MDENPNVKPWQRSTLEYNPYLKPWQRPAPSARAGEGEIERPGQIANIIWQTRAAPPNEYENRLGDALEEVFESGAVELHEVVAKLNELGFRSSDGQPWTAASFEAEMARLGA